MCGPNLRTILLKETSTKYSINVIIPFLDMEVYRIISILHLFDHPMAIDGLNQTTKSTLAGERG